MHISLLPGDIFVDDENIRDLDPEWLRHNIGVVSQVGSS